MNGKKSKKRNVRQMGHDLIEEMFNRGKGRSKHQDRQSKMTENRIYSQSTAKNYHSNWNRFCDYLDFFVVSGQIPKPIVLTDCVPYVAGYLSWLSAQKGKGKEPMSAWTIRAYFSAVAKVLGLSARDYILPARLRKDIRRSRKKETSAFCEENHAALVAFQRAIGARKKKELAQLRGTDLIRNAGGAYSVHIRRGKGGLERVVPVIGTPAAVDLVVHLMTEAGDGLVWPALPSHYDAHADRAYYASLRYLLTARDPMLLPRKDRIYLRRDLAGAVLDRRAVMTASHALGHFRPEIITGHYLYRLADALLDPAASAVDPAVVASLGPLLTVGRQRVESQKQAAKTQIAGETQKSSSDRAKTCYEEQTTTSNILPSDKATLPVEPLMLPSEIERQTVIAPEGVLGSVHVASHLTVFLHRENNAPRLIILDEKSTPADCLAVRVGQQALVSHAQKIEQSSNWKAPPLSFNDGKTTVIGFYLAGFEDFGITPLHSRDQYDHIRVLSVHAGAIMPAHIPRFHEFRLAG